MIRKSIPALSVILLLGLVCDAEAQAPSEAGGAAAAYRHAAPSVFLVEVRDDDGVTTGLGSAFLVSDGKLITNSHVIGAGRPFLITGAVALPLTVERRDPHRDLAVLTSSTPLDADPLPFSDTEPEVGTAVYAVGSPHGLERTISEGIVSGYREVDGMRVLQMTAPISPGSSGGPVVDSRGRVVGVTVAYLDGGQNLNFAVLVADVVRLLEGERGSHFADRLAEVEALAGIVPSYGDWGRHRSRFKASVADAAASAETGEDLLTLATLARRGLHLGESVSLAERALKRGTEHPDSARIIMIEGWNLSLLFARTSNDDMDPAQLEHYLEVADRVALARPSRFETHLFRARVLEFLPGRAADAVSASFTALEVARRGGQVPSDLWSAVHVIVGRSGSPAEDDAVFIELLESGSPSTGDWTGHAQHLAARGNWLDAGESYLEVYALDNSQPTSLCDAGRMFYLANDWDLALDSFRMCVDQNVFAETVDTANVALAHMGLAMILVDRGVYPSAEAHARQAWQLDHTNEWAAHALAQALLGQERYREAAAAAEEAIRLSDGSVSSMHFAAGSAHFELAEWSQCARAFRRADQLNPESTAAAYNTGLCLARQGFYRDAAQWMDRVLERDSSRSDRRDIEAMIRRWRG